MPAPGLHVRLPVVVLLALGLGLLEQLLELDGREALLAVGAVVGHHVQMIAAGAHLVLEHDDALAHHDLFLRS